MSIFHIFTLELKLFTLLLSIINIDIWFNALEGDNFMQIENLSCGDHTDFNFLNVYSQNQKNCLILLKVAEVLKEKSIQ